MVGLLPTLILKAGEGTDNGLLGQALRVIQALSCLQFGNLFTQGVNLSCHKSAAPLDKIPNLTLHLGHVEACHCKLFFKFVGVTRILKITEESIHHLEGKVASSAAHHVSHFPEVIEQRAQHFVHPSFLVNR
ncbi:hypothetical protein E2C01_025386 [Portunus trituberculatus]|uniref:Uncharacterized protein n=1 Tax=Portunus trituberculatus TaxID=210409 RepID=A0A5B7ED81_PORTR|nr:hypothetical protein [Portunus trituberculatus]